MIDPAIESRSRAPQPALVDAAAFRAAIRDAFLKLAPRHIAKSPVMAIVLGGTLLAALITASGNAPAGFGWAVTAILFVTVLFGNFAEAVAEARGRGQAASLRRARKDLVARRLVDSKAFAPDMRGGETRLPAAELKPGDHVVVSEGELIPADGEIVHGLATINEAAVTGESAPVLREAGTDRSGVIGGTKVITIVGVPGPGGQRPSPAECVFGIFDGPVLEDDPPLVATRLIGRSVWNTGWMLIIPGQTLHNDPATGLSEFINNVSDITLTFETYGYSGN